MEFGGKITIETKVPVQKIWDTFLNDTSILCAVIPGGEKVDKVDDKTYQVVLKQGVGPFKFTFDMDAVLTDVVPPTHAEIEGEGKDRKGLGNFKMKMIMDLKDNGNGTMDIDYNVSATVGGKLGSFGDRILNAKTKTMEKEVKVNLEKALGSIS
ncbi:MAG: SRPBCC domain-containing protein [Leptospirales bacterium]|nr:SRPBCC domain-containing protein [Leptospirales bacterium]